MRLKMRRVGRPDDSSYAASISSSQARAWPKARFISACRRGDDWPIRLVRTGNGPYIVAIGHAFGGPSPRLSSKTERRTAGAGRVAHSHRFIRQLRCCTIPYFGRGPIIGLRFRIRLFGVGTPGALLLDLVKITAWAGEGLAYAGDVQKETDQEGWDNRAH